jgi:hypothetical protein
LVRLNDLENNQATLNKINNLFSYLDSKYSNEFCKIDVNTSNPARQLAIPGTWKYKDTFSTPDRPHRMVVISQAARQDEPSQTV